jgi:hypothetical protein
MTEKFLNSLGEPQTEVFNGELKLRQAILPQLKEGRGNFDLLHTEAVVYWMKWLLDNEPGLNKMVNPKVMITASYAHDWGYVGLFKGVNSDDPKIIASRKPLHMQLGEQKIGELLGSDDFFGLYTEKEIKLTQHLVGKHDLVESLSGDAEILIMEADTLGMLDAGRVKPSFSKADNQRFMIKEIGKRRTPRFIHSKAKEVLPELIAKRTEFYSLI